MKTNTTALSATLVLLGWCLFAGSAAAAPINVVPYAGIGPNVVNFEDVAGAAFPGVNYNGILVSGGASLAERFAGQTLSFNGDLDVLSGIPTGPLTLQVGAAGANLAIGTDTGTRGLYPYGQQGFPTAAGYGEGSFAILFPGLVSEFGFQAFFGDGNNEIFVQFFRQDGSLIDSVSVAAAGNHGFQREFGVQDIAGVSIHTNDSGGLGYDNLVYGNFISASSVVPEPASLAMWSLASAAGLAAWRRRKNAAGA